MTTSQEIISKNSFTIFDFLYLLKKTGCRVDLQLLNYNRIGKKTELDKNLTEDEKKELIDAIESARSQEEVTAAVEKIAASKREIKFHWNSPEQKIAELTWHETRPNVSMLFHIDGVAEIGENSFGLDKEFKTSVWRNYTIIRDGLLNIDVIPVFLTKDAYDILSQLEIIEGEFKEGKVYEIELNKIPLLKEEQCGIAFSDYFKKLYELFSLKAAKKVYTALQKEVNPVSKVSTLAELYGEDASQWLLSIGITDQGFSPKVKELPGKERYKAIELVTKIKGISSIPSYNAFMKKFEADKKLNDADMLLMKPYSECVEIRKKNIDNDDFSKLILIALLDIEGKIKKLSMELAKIRFSIISGQVRFNEFDTIENCKLPVELIEGREIECSMELKETEVEI